MYYSVLYPLTQDDLRKFLHKQKIHYLNKKHYLYIDDPNGEILIKLAFKITLADNREGGCKIYYLS